MAKKHGLTVGVLLSDIPPLALADATGHLYAVVESDDFNGRRLAGAADLFEDALQLADGRERWTVYQRVSAGPWRWVKGWAGELIEG